MLVTVLVLAGIAVGVPLGVYGRWSGWGFGLGWWGVATPARVVQVTPLAGARMRGHSEQSLVEQTHRVALTLEVRPPGGEPYEATAVAWQGPTDTLAGRTLTVRVSHTRPGRVFVPKD